MGETANLDPEAKSPLPRALLLCFVLSGATSLTLEVVWSKQLSFLLGNSLYAVSTVVAAFMAGLGLGGGLASRFGARIRSPLRAYGLLQVAIGAFGIVSVPLLRATGPLFSTLYAAWGASPGGFLAARFAVVFLLLVVPTTAMGMTLPVLVGASSRGRSGLARHTALLYGVNTLGAVAGTLGAGFVLLGGLGLWKSALAAGVVDLLVGLYCVQVARRITTPLPEAADLAHTRPPWTGAQRAVIALFALSGFAALAVEVVWFRLLGLTLGPSTYAFSALLGVYLAGIGLGSALLARSGTRSGFLARMALGETLLGCLVVAQLFYANRLPAWNLAIHRGAEAVLGENAFVASHLGLAAVVVFLPCLLLGALFPTAVGAVREAGGAVAPETAVGRLYLWNTVGSIAGSLVAGFVALPRLGLWPSLQCAALLSCGIGLGFLILARRGHAGARGWQVTSAALAGLALLLAALAPRYDAAFFNQGLYRSLFAHDPGAPAQRAGRLIFQREGLNAPVAVFRTFGTASLYIGGKPDASTALGDLPTQALSGHLPLLAHAAPRRVMVLGYRSGMTTGAILTHPEVESVDLLELEPGVIEASPYFAPVNDNPLADPRTHLHLEDGRIHLAYTRERYDVITSEPSNPWMAGISNLFTVEFYRLVRARLAEGGVFGQWIQNYDISEEAQRTILASIREVFPHLMLFRTTPGDMVVVASMEPIRIPWSEVARRTAVPRVAASLRQVGVANPLELGFFLQVPDPAVQALVRGATRRSTDDNVWLEHAMPRQMWKARGGIKNAGLALVATAVDTRLAAWGESWPGVPVPAMLRATVLFPYRAEPRPSGEEIDADPWQETRVVLLDGLLRSAAGTPGATDAIRAWDQEGRSYRDARRAATRTLLEARRRPEGPTEEEVSGALEAAPDLPLALTTAARMWTAAGDAAAAESLYLRVVPERASDHRYEALLGLGVLARAGGDSLGARRWAEAAQEANPYLPAAYLFLAEGDLIAGRPEAALSVLEEGLRMNPDNREMTELKGRIEGR